MVEEHFDVGLAKIEGNVLVLSAIIFMIVCGCNWCLWIVLYDTNSLTLLLKTIVHSNINIYSCGIEIWETWYQIKLKYISEFLRAVRVSIFELDLIIARQAKTVIEKLHPWY